MHRRGEYVDLDDAVASQVIHHLLHVCCVHGPACAKKNVSNHFCFFALIIYIIWQRHEHLIYKLAILTS